MRLSLVAAAALLVPACGKEKPKKEEAPPPTSVSVTPKKEVVDKALPPLAADPGGATGRPIWHAGFGGLGIDSAKGIAVGPGGGVYVIGYFEGEIDFGAPVGKKASAGKSDAFLAKVVDGKMVWAQTWG